MPQTMIHTLQWQYMINDIESFEVHLHALESMLESFSADEENELLSFVRGRVLA